MRRLTPRAFSLPEIMIGLVLLGTLSAIAMFSLGSLQEKNREHAIKNSARLFDETYRARLAYDIDLGATGADDLTARIDLALQALGEDVSVTASSSDATFTKQGSSVCLTFATDPDTPGVISSGEC